MSRQKNAVQFRPDSLEGHITFEQPVGLSQPEISKDQK
jgi:hypothetical protein